MRKDRGWQAELREVAERGETFIFGRAKLRLVLVKGRRRVGVALIHGRKETPCQEDPPFVWSRPSRSPFSSCSRALDKPPRGRTWRPAAPLSWSLSRASCRRPSGLG